MKKTYGVVIAAGGSGTRFGSDIPKQFVDALGIPVIAHTISKFSSCDYISKIVIAVHKDYVVFCSDIVKRFGYSKVTSIVQGGTTRQESVFKALKTLDTDYVLIHDAARPCIDLESISKCCQALQKYKACAVGAKATDTVKISDDGEYITGTLDREKLWLIQTPQCFDREFILSCHKKAAFDKIAVTDDCMLAEYYGEKVRLIETTRSNIKITNYNDLAIAEVLLDD